MKQLEVVFKQKNICIIFDLAPQIWIVMFFVAEMGRGLIEHGRVQALRELQFLSDVNCVAKRAPAGSAAAEGGAAQYFFFSKPDIVLKGFVRPKDIYNFWERFVPKCHVLSTVYSGV